MLNTFKNLSIIFAILMFLVGMTATAPLPLESRLAFVWVLVVIIFAFAFCLTMVFKLYIEYSQKLMAHDYSVKKVNDHWGMYHKDRGQIVEWWFSVNSYEGALVRAAEYIDNGFRL